MVGDGLYGVCYGVCVDFIDCVIYVVFVGVEVYCLWVVVVY